MMCTCFSEYSTDLWSTLDFHFAGRKKVPMQLLSITVRRPDARRHQILIHRDRLGENWDPAAQQAAPATSFPASCDFQPCHGMVSTVHPNAHPFSSCWQFSAWLLYLLVGLVPRGYTYTPKTMFVSSQNSDFVKTLVAGEGMLHCCVFITNAI